MNVRVRLRVAVLTFGVVWPSLLLGTVGPPVKVRLVGEPHAIEAGRAFEGKLEILAGREGLVSGLRFEAARRADGSLGAGPVVGRLDMLAADRVGPARPLEVGFELFADPAESVLVAFEFDGVTVRKALDLSREHLERMRDGVPLVRLDGEKAEAAPDEETLSSRTVHVVGRFMLERPARCVDTDGDFKIDGCAGTSTACFDDAACSDDYVGADVLGVEVKDDRAGLPDSVLASGTTDGEGYFDLSFSTDGSPDLYVLFETKNGPVEVEDATWESNYRYRTATHDNFGGTRLDFGIQVPTAYHGAVQLHNTITRVARWNAELIGDWAPNVDVQWPDDSTYYQPYWNEIHVESGYQWIDWAAAHEWGHLWMDHYAGLADADYGNGVCDGGSDGGDEGHCVWCDETVGIAWNEGWADWLATASLRSYRERYGRNPLLVSSYLHNFDAPPPGPTCYGADGPCACSPARAEGYVAGALLDIDDDPHVVTKQDSLTSTDIQHVFDFALGALSQSMLGGLWANTNLRIAVDVDPAASGLDPRVTVFCPFSPGAGCDADDDDSGANGVSALIPSHRVPAGETWLRVVVRASEKPPGGTWGGYTLRITNLDDHDGDGITDELALGPAAILSSTRAHDPANVDGFLEWFGGDHPANLEGLWGTAKNAGYDLPDYFAPSVPTALTSTSHTVGGRSELPSVTFTWVRATDDISGVDGYNVVMNPGYAAPPANTGPPSIGNVTTYTTGPLAPGVYYFTIRAHDRSGKWSTTYAALGPIEIVPPCNLTIEAPAGGEAWTLGTTHTVAWTCHRDTGSYGAETVKLELLQGTTPVRTIANSNGSSIAWPIPLDVAPGAGYRIRVSSHAWPDDTATSGTFTLQGDLIDHGNGTVSHINACLMWLKNASQAGTTMTWGTAAAWARDLAFAGHADWRLPTGRNPDGTVCDSGPSGANCAQTELGTLYFGRLIRFGHADPFVLGGLYYWTGTTFPSDPTRAMMQDMLDGGQNDASKDSHAGPWAVRVIPGCTPAPGFPPVRWDSDGDGFAAQDDCNDGAATISPLAAEVCGNGTDDDCDGAADEYCSCGEGLVDHGDGTVTELSTCLMWMKDFSGGFSGATWPFAMSWAESLVFAGHDDWRLPVTAIPDASCDYYDSYGYHCSASEMGHLHYVTLGNVAGQPPGCTTPFLHYGQSWSGGHWSATSDPGNADYAYTFRFAGSSSGWQSAIYKYPTPYSGQYASMFPVRLDLDCWGDSDGDGHQRGTDCDDNDATVYPGADEICDGKDNDCDGATDPGFVLGAVCTSGAGACATDGTTVCSTAGRGTALVEDLLAGPDGSGPDAFKVVGETLFFRAYDPVHGSELWKTDGTTGGAALVRDIRPGDLDASLDYLTAAGSTLFFVANDGTTGLELWKSDGTTGGTALVRDIRAGATGSGPTSLTAVGSTLFFTANDGSSGVELWKSDGTTGGTVRVKDIYAGAGNSSPQDLVVMNGILYFSAIDNTHGRELWRSDGTDAGTWLVKDISTGQSWIEHIATTGSLLYLSAYEPASGDELWRSDGTAAGTWLILDAVPGTGGSNPSQLVAAAGLLFYLASDPAHGQELWRSDGTAGGTFLVRDIQPGPDGSLAIALTPVGSRIMLLANNGVTGREPWVSDGTPAGTWLVRDVTPGPAGTDPYCMLGVGNLLYFCGEDPAYGVELWTSDGTYGGTSLVLDLRPDGSSFPRSPVLFRNLVYFGANDGTIGTELFSTDGTSDGTRCGAVAGTPTDEVCNGTDDDCDGTDDEESVDASAWHPDADGDGYGDPAGSTLACSAPTGFVADGTDCDDTTATVRPGLVEAGCDGLDNDCAPETPDLLDADGDGLDCAVDCDDARSSCTTDCSDADGDGIAECAESLADSDSDGILPPEDCNDADPNNWNACATCRDLDGDGAFVECDAYVTIAGPDCDDTAASNAPGFGEVCDGLDNDCDGAADEGCDGTCDAPEKHGAELDLTPAALGAAGGRLAWNGTGYGLVWSDQRDGNPEIYFTLLDATMNRIGSDVRLTDAAGVSDSPWIVWTGRDYGVAFEDTRDGNSRIYFIRVDASGIPIGTERLAVATETATSRTPRLVWNGVEFGLFWNDNRDGSWENLFRTIDAEGAVLGAPRAISTTPYDSNPCQAAWNGSGYTVVYNDIRTGDWEIYLVRLDAAGLRLGPEQRLTFLAGTSRSPSIVWRGTEYGVFWIDNHYGPHELFYARVGLDGVKIGGDVRLTTVNGILPLYSAAWTGEEYGLAWIDTKDGNSEVYFERIDTSGAFVAPELRVTNDLAVSQTPSLQWNEDGFALAFVDARTGSNAVFGVRIACCDDVDGDAVNECHDCDDADPATHPGAGEVNDGRDNQCGGDPGFGLVDEISGTAGFVTAGDPLRFSWTPQPGATLYEVALSLTADFADCTVLQTSAPELVVSEVPPPGSVLHILARPLAPFAGSWGADSSGTERALTCGGAGPLP